MKISEKFCNFQTFLEKKRLILSNFCQKQKVFVFWSSLKFKKLSSPSFRFLKIYLKKRLLLAQCRHNACTMTVQCLHNKGTMPVQCRQNFGTMPEQCWNSARTNPAQCRHNVSSMPAQCDTLPTQTGTMPA